MTRKTGYIIFAHGSSVESANAGVRLVAAEFASRQASAMVETAFLELAEPSLATAVDALAARGVRQIFVLPYFLTLGIHLKRDLPKLAAEAAARHSASSITIHIAPPLDGHPGLVDVLLQRAAEAAR